MRNLSQRISTGLIWAVALSSVPFASADANIEAREFKAKDEGRLLYRILIPDNYDANVAYPLVLSLHGGGGRGDDNMSRGNAVFPVLSTSEMRAKYPCFLVTPQSPKDDKWADEEPKHTYSLVDTPITKTMTRVYELLDALQDEFSIDADRLYITGVSMGGAGTWDCIMRRPMLFAAAVPVCANNDPSQARRVAHMPIWAFHGGEDKMVPTKASRDIVANLKTAGSAIKYTEYEGVGHGAAGPAYKEEELFPWLFSQRRKTIDTPPAAPDGWTDGYVLANGIRIHYWRTGGDKPPMIMAHGSSDNGMCWTNLALELVDDYDIILPDARGHGLSDPNSADDPADAQAEDLMGLISALQLEKPIVMGHSMGSAAAAWFAAKYPDVPRAVILEDPRLTPRRANDPRMKADPKAQERRRAHILLKNNTPYADLVIQCMKGNPQWGLSECEYWAPSKRFHHPNTAYRNLGARPAMSDLFAKITAPTLILKADAEGDERKQNEEVAAILKTGKLVHVEGARHNVRRDQKERLLAALKAFLVEL